MSDERLLTGDEIEAHLVERCPKLKEVFDDSPLCRSLLDYFNRRKRIDELIEDM